MIKRGEEQIRFFKKIKKEHFMIIGALIGLAILMYYIFPIAKPIVLALITALLIERIVNITKNKLRVSRTPAILIVFFVFVTTILGTATFLVTKSVVHVVDFVENFPSFLSKINILYEDVNQKIRQLADGLPREFVKNATETANNTFESMLDTLKDKISLENITKLARVIPTFLVNFIVYVLALMLFMFELPILKRGLRKILKEGTKRNVLLIKQKIEDTVFGVAKAQLLLSLITFIIALFGLMILQVESILALAVLIWFIDLLPIVGSVIILIPWGLYTLYTGDVFLGGGLLILGGIIAVVRRIIEPKVMSVNIGLSPLAALVSVFIGFKIFGFIGLIAGPLIFIILKSLVDEGVIKINFKI